MMRSNWDSGGFGFLLDACSTGIGIGKSCSHRFRISFRVSSLGLHACISTRDPPCGEVSPSFLSCCLFMSRDFTPSHISGLDIKTRFVPLLPFSGMEKIGNFSFVQT